MFIPSTRELQQRAYHGILGNSALLGKADVTALTGRCPAQCKTPGRGRVFLVMREDAPSSLTGISAADRHAHPWSAR
ncbi:hypothetical protein ABTK14_20395, partial [Acinetobacter baumannii]